MYKDIDAYVEQTMTYFESALKIWYLFYKQWCIDNNLPRYNSLVANIADLTKSGSISAFNSFLFLLRLELKNLPCLSVRLLIRLINSSLNLSIFTNRRVSKQSAVIYHSFSHHTVGALLGTQEGWLSSSFGIGDWPVTIVNYESGLDQS